MVVASCVAWFCAGVGLPAPLDPAEVMTLFEAASYRPEILGPAADTVRFENALDSSPTSPVDPAVVSRRFWAAVEPQVRDADIENLRVVRSLTPLQATVLRVLAADGKAYAPFEPPTLDAYRRVLQSIQGDSGARQAQLETPSVQPRNGSWTRPSEPGCGSLARREDAAGSCPRGQATPPAGRSPARSGA